MSIEKDYKEGTYTAVCDECHDVIAEDCASFHEAIEAIKEHEGVVRPLGRGWTHICRYCRED